MTREEYFTTIADRLKPDELKYVQTAYWLVKDAHRRQHRRLTGERFFEHVRRVSYSAAIEFGHWNPETLTLGLLHDVIEDTFVPSGVIPALFGQQMYKWTLALSKEIPAFNEITGTMIKRAKKTDDEYYPALDQADTIVKIIKGCDRLDNLDDLHKWEEARRDKYVRETNEKVLPIIRKSDMRIVHRIEEKLALAIAA